MRINVVIIVLFPEQEAVGVQPARGQCLQEKQESINSWCRNCRTRNAVFIVTPRLQRHWNSSARSRKLCFEWPNSAPVLIHSRHPEIDGGAATATATVSLQGTTCLFPTTQFFVGLKQVILADRKLSIEERWSLQHCVKMHQNKASSRQKIFLNIWRAKPLPSLLFIGNRETHHHLLPPSAPKYFAFLYIFRSKRPPA